MDASQILMQNVDKTQLPALHQKRILAFVNHFLISSCAFLNEFAAQCESKFIELERKLQKIEAALIILEAKLDLIPNVNHSKDEINSNMVEEKETTIQTENETAHNKESSDEALIKGMKICEHEKFVKFFKMLQFGVPTEAVKMKMTIEGVDPSMLDCPNKIVPPEEGS